MTGFLLTKDADDVVEYGLAVANPANHIQYLEIDTDDPEVVGYWQYLCVENGVKPTCATCRRRMHGLG